MTGLVASRLSEKHGKPVVLLGPENGLVKGSIRTSLRINVLALLRPLADYLLEFGGHTQAAGFTLAAENLATFLTAWEGKCGNLNLEHEPP